MPDVIIVHVLSIDGSCIFKANQFDVLEVDEYANTVMQYIYVKLRLGCMFNTILMAGNSMYVEKTFCTLVCLCTVFVS